MDERPNIVIGTPCYGGLVAHIYMQSVINLMMYGSRHNIAFNLALAAHDSLITRSRNSIVAAFLDIPTATHLMFIDADIGFEPEAVERLIKFDVDVVAGMYPLKVIHWPQTRTRMDVGSTAEEIARAGLNYVGIQCKGEDRQENNGFVTGLYAGTGFMLIKRRTIEAMTAAYPNAKYKSIQTYPIPKTPSNNQYNLFDCMIDPESGTYLSEDFAFCQRWRDCGGKIWLDRTSKLTHVGSYEFAGDAAETM